MTFPILVLLRRHQGAKKYDRRTIDQNTRTMVNDMNNLYVISKYDRFHQADYFGPVEDEHYLTGIDESPLQDRDESTQEKRVEHRCYKRFQLRKDAFALIRSTSTGPLNIQGKSMGCIACAVFDARPVRLGKIENISTSGLMFYHVGRKAPLSKAFVLDILVADCGFYLAGMPYKTITDDVIPEDVPGDSIEMSQVRVQFHQLSVNQETRLNEIILNHGVDIGKNSFHQ